MKPKLAKTHVRAGEQLAERMGVKIIETTTGALFTYQGQTLALANDKGVAITINEKLPLRVARALGHFLVNNSREQR